MGRRHVGIALALVAAVVATEVAAATTLRWTSIASGQTVPSGSQVATAHLAYSLRQERTWIGRIEVAQRAKLRAVDFSQRTAIAVFLDGSPCASKVAIGTVTRSAATVTVHVQYTPPPVGVATCIRINTPYVVLTVPRKALGTTPPTHVRLAITMRARA